MEGNLFLACLSVKEKKFFFSIKRREKKNIDREIDLSYDIIKLAREEVDDGKERKKVEKP